MPKIIIKGRLIADSSVAAIGNAHKCRMTLKLSGDISYILPSKKFSRNVEFATMAFRITAETDSGS